MLIVGAGDKNIDQVLSSPKMYFNKTLFVIKFTLYCFLVIFNQVNRIRDSLAVMGDNSTAFSLPQVCVCLIFLTIFT